MLERQAAAERSLADQQRRARVVVAGGDLGERGQRAGVDRLVGEIGDHRGDEIALVDGVEDLEGARDFEPALLRRRLRHRTQRDLAEPKSRPGELAVIGGRDSAPPLR